MATSRDPGSLGVYGFRNRKDHSYDGLSIIDSRAIRDLAIWDQIAREGGRSIIVGVPPCFPPRKVNGISVGCFLTPDTRTDVYTHPASVGRRLTELVGEYPVDVKGFRTENKEWLHSQIEAMTRKHFTVIRTLLREEEWDYFQFVEIGLDRIQHGFWKHHDPAHVLHEPNSPYTEVIRDYYRLLDEEIGSVLELIDSDTAVLVVSDHGARALDGGFCVNEWLVDQGWLVLKHQPTEVTPFAELDVDWSRTKAWSEGGYYARVFLNVAGREPEGVIAPEDYEAVRNELKQMLEDTVDPEGRLLGTLVFKPEEVYREMKNVAPDLLVHFGALAWRSIGGVGYGRVHVLENDTGPDDCNHAQYGAFVLAAPGAPPLSQLTGVHLLDIAPTLLELGGYEVPETMQGKAIPLRADTESDDTQGYSQRGEELVRARLAGLGYIS